jgi:hypothetical protein
MMTRCKSTVCKFDERLLARSPINSFGASNSKIVIECRRRAAFQTFCLAASAKGLTHPVPIPIYNLESPLVPAPRSAEGLAMPGLITCSHAGPSSVRFSGDPCAMSYSARYTSPSARPSALFR